MIKGLKKLYGSEPACRKRSDSDHLKFVIHKKEDEYLKFPRGTFVDILDALSSIEEIAYPPEKEKELNREPAPNSPEYEKWYIRKILAEKARQANESSD